MNAAQLAALLAEELPTGLFGGPRPEPPHVAAVDPCAAQHVADLRAALDAHNRSVNPRRTHLHVVPDEALRDAS